MARRHVHMQAACMLSKLVHQALNFAEASLWDSNAFNQCPSLRSPASNGDALLQATVTSHFSWSGPFLDVPSRTHAHTSPPYHLMCCRCHNCFTHPIQVAPCLVCRHSLLPSFLNLGRMYPQQMPHRHRQRSTPRLPGQSLPGYMHCGEGVSPAVSEEAGMQRLTWL